MKYQTDRYRDSIVLTPAVTPRASIIWLHGLGADGTDFVPLVPQLQLPDAIAPRFIFPNAPVRPVTVNQGMRMPAWYDIYSFGLRDREDAAGIRESAGVVHGLIDAERTAGIATERIVVAGFSQGGAVALQAGLRYAQPLAGILALSTYLPLAATLGAEGTPANRAVPILICHGREDPIVPLALARKSFDALRTAGYAPQLLEYSMPHTLCGDEVIAISRWLVQVLPPL